MNTESSLLSTLRDHPVITAGLGIAPLVVMAQTLLSAAVMALSFSISLILSMLSVFLFRRLIPHDYRLPFILLISSTWVTVMDLSLQTICYEMRAGLDIYIPLIAMNSLLLWMLDGVSLKRSFMAGIVSSLSTCVVVILICVVSGGIRELLTQGMFLSDIGLLFPEINVQSYETAVVVLNLPLMATSSGALLILGCVLAGTNLALSLLNNEDITSRIVPETDSGEDRFEH